MKSFRIERFSSRNSKRLVRLSTLEIGEAFTAFTEKVPDEHYYTVSGWDESGRRYTIRLDAETVSELAILALKQGNNVLL